MRKVKEIGIELFRLISIFFFIFIYITDAPGQRKQTLIRRYWNNLVNDTSDISQPQFLIYPSVAYSPETSWELGLSTLYVFYSNNDTNNRLSEINGFTFYTLQNQFGVWFDHAYYSDKDKWFFLGRTRFQSFPLLYFGIGPDTPETNSAVVDANQVLLRERVLRKIRRNLYTGGIMDLQWLSAVSFRQNNINPVELPIGSDGSVNLGFGTGIIYDNRHNVLNVRHGFFSEVAVLRYDKLWGSDFSFTTVTLDSRIFLPVNKRDVFAAQILGQFNNGTTPFNHLALLGGESMMRGFYTGRYRDNNMIAGQAEYRFLPLPLPFSKRIGASIFAGAGTVFNEVNNLSLNKFVYSGGAGLKFLIFPKKDIYTRLDFAITHEGNGIYIYIGEAF